MASTTEETRIEYGSGNVFVDLGFPDSAEHLAKAKLVRAIGSVLGSRHITLAQVAKFIGIDQPKMSKLLRGQFQGFSSARLVHFLNLLGQDIVITIVSGPPTENRNGHISVAIT
jgi:predicted XRE-type DNA-binding protein